MSAAVQPEGACDAAHGGHRRAASALASLNDRPGSALADATLTSAAMSTTAQHGVPDIRRRVLRGLVWVGASQVGLQLTRAVVAIAIARLLTPDEYGLAALALVFASLVLVFSDLALGAALIQRKTLTERRPRHRVLGHGGRRRRSSPALGVALAGPIASLYGEPDAKPLLVALSATLRRHAPSGATQQYADAARHGLPARRGAADWSARSPAASCGVALAALGAGAWAIIVQQLVATVAHDRCSCGGAPQWRPRFTFSRASLRDLGGFSVYMLGHRMLYYLQVERRPLPDRPLPRHRRARHLRRRLQHDARAREQARRPAAARVLAGLLAASRTSPSGSPPRGRASTRVLAAVAVPALAGLDRRRARLRAASCSATSGTTAVPVVQILAWVGIIQALQSLNMRHPHGARPRADDVPLLDRAAPRAT